MKNMSKAYICPICNQKIEIDDGYWGEYEGKSICRECNKNLKKSNIDTSDLSRFSLKELKIKANIIKVEEKNTDYTKKNNIEDDNTKISIKNYAEIDNTDENVSKQLFLNKRKTNGTKFNKKLKIVFIVIIVFAIFTAILSSDVESGNLLMQNMDMNEEQEAIALDVFEKCGIGKIVSVTQFQKGDIQTSYQIEDEETQAYAGVENTIVVWINNETKEIEQIYFHDNDIYINGEVKSKVSDYYVSSDERNNYRVSSQMLVTNVLNNPDTAKFPAISGWSFKKENGIIVIQSSVTSKNDFGVDKTHQFQVKYKNGNPTSFIIDNKEYLK